ncbi:MAG: serine/threonine-protein kinase, partial [Pyrinomonadaceae bacterium]
MTSAGKVLQNRYSVNKQIGAGGMGTVYVATDQRFGSTVAIKETLFTDPNLRRAFEREAQLLNSLRHPALPRVSDHFTEGNGAFIVMEYIAGEDLSAMVERDGAFAVSDVLRWADNLLDALDYLHNQKFPVIHRDIKPQNLKLTPRGEIILLDFGLAKGSASELSQISMTKSVFGYSRSYAPLEQIQGTGTDPRSDLYGLAATLYHLVTGKPPVDALTRATAVLNGNPDPLPSANTLNSKIPVSVSNVFHQAMALNANLRPMTAAQMR